MLKINWSRFKKVALIRTVFIKTALIKTIFIKTAQIRAVLKKVALTKRLKKNPFFCSVWFGEVKNEQYCVIRSESLQVWNKDVRYGAGPCDHIYI
jgi:hypothetical protein